MKIKSVLVFLVVAVTAVVNAQTLPEAIKLSENEQFETATKMFKQLLLQKPDNGDIYYYFGDNYLNNESNDSAFYYYNKGTQVAPNNALNFIGLGKLQRVEGKKAEAKAMFDKALAMGLNKNVLIMLKTAEALIDTPSVDLDQAVKILDMAAKLEPKNPQVYILMGDLNLEKNDGNTAILQYKKAQELNTKSALATIKIGRLYARAKNYPLALDYYREAAKIDSSFAPAYREQGEVYYKAKQYGKAKSMYKRYLDLSGNNFSGKQRYASFLFLNKDYAESIELFNELEKQDTSKNFVNRLQGYARYETGNFADGWKYLDKFFSREAVEKRIKILPSDYEYRAKLNAKTGRDSLAIIDFKKALEMDSTKYDLYSEMATVYFKLKKYSEAIEATQKKLTASKKLNANDYFSMGRAYYFSKDFINADSAFAMVTTLQSTLAIGYLWRAKAEVQLDPDTKLGLAKPNYEKFIELTTDIKKNMKDLIDAYSYLGYYYMLQKDNAKAKENWTKVAELDPANEKAKKALESIK